MREWILGGLQAALFLLSLMAGLFLVEQVASEGVSVFKGALIPVLWLLACGAVAGRWRLLAPEAIGLLWAFAFCSAWGSFDEFGAMAAVEDCAMLVFAALGWLLGRLTARTAGGSGASVVFGGRE